MIVGGEIGQTRNVRCRYYDSMKTTVRLILNAYGMTIAVADRDDRRVVTILPAVFHDRGECTGSPVTNLCSKFVETFFHDPTSTLLQTSDLLYTKEKKQSLSIRSLLAAYLLQTLFLSLRVEAETQPGL